MSSHPHPRHRQHRLQNFFDGIHVNQIIKILTLSDLLVWSGFGLVSPILAVFITQQIVGGSLEVAGFASAIYFITKSIFQLPVARLIDLRKGEHDDYLMMLVGAFLVGVSPFFYLIATFPWHIYLIQAAYGLGNALAFVSWDAIFNRHVDKGEVALEYSLYYTINDLGGAVAAAVGGVLAEKLGFRPLFLLVGLITSAGAVLLLNLAKHFKKTQV